MNKIRYIDSYIKILDKFEFNYENKDLIADYFLNRFNDVSVDDKKFAKITKCLKSKVSDIKITSNLDNARVSFNVQYTIDNKKQEKNIAYNIPPNIYKYRNTSSDYQILLFYLIFHFESNHIWGLGPDVYKYLTKQHKSMVECFANLYNKTLDHYCSSLDIEEKFGSQGNFFEVFLDSKYDVYVMVPPFNMDILLKVFGHIIEKLKSKKNIIIYLYLLAWNDIFKYCVEKINYHEVIKVNKLYNYTANKYITGDFYLTILSNYQADFNKLKKPFLKYLL